MTNIAQVHEPTRREFLRTIGAGAAALALPNLFARTAWAAGDKRPNIVLILADDLGYECLGCDGGTSYQTPQLDALAKTGVRFEHCHAQPLCTPTRLELMTGRYNHRNYTRWGYLDPKETTFAQMLKKAGYATCIAGKWQLEGGFKGPNSAGFDEYCLWQLFPQNMGSRYADPKIHQNGALLEGTKGKYGPDIECDFLLDFIARNKARAADPAHARPFLAYYAMTLVHNPVEPTPDTPPNKKRGYFADMVAYMDKLVGRIVARLDELGLRENTLILFVGDNGTTAGVASRMGERRIVGAKGSTIDTGTHVPLIASWKGTTPAGKVCDDLIDMTDFFPTFAAATGAELPKGVTIDGHSFLPQLEGQPGEPREWIFSHYDPKQGGFKRARFARDKRWKLYDTGKLFDVAADPEEKKPIAEGEGGDEAAAARKKLAVALEQFKKP